MPTPDTLSTGQQPGDAASPGDTHAADHTTTAPNGAPAMTKAAKGSPAKGAHRFGDDGAKAES